MKLFELKQFIEDYKQLKAKILPDADGSSSFFAENEGVLLTSLEDFIGQHSSVCDDSIIDFSAFLQSLQAQESPIIDSNESGLLAKFCIIWLKETQYSNTTFMSTSVAEISLNNLLFIDGHYASAEEILSSLQSNAESGKNIYINPYCHPQALFSENIQNILKKHNVTREFIFQHEERQKQIAEAVFPDMFYDELEKYLIKLHDIGCQSTPWSFPDSKITACEIINTEFIANIKQEFGTEWELLTQKLIEVPFRNSLEKASGKFGTIVKGDEPFECIITQQIYLWAMLRQKRPNVLAQANVINSFQAIVFDLGPPRIEKKKSSQPDNKSFGKGFTGLRGAFLGNRSSQQLSKKESIPKQEEFGQGLTGLRGALLSSPKNKAFLRLVKTNSDFSEVQFSD